jgi:hypothetical protein
MEPSVEVYQPSQLYSRVGWVALAGSAACVLCGFRAPLAFIPGVLCAATSAFLFWLAARPVIRVGETQFNIGERAIAWREVVEINSSRFVSPLLLRIKLTNSRHKMLIFPGEPEKIARLMFQLRKYSSMASFDGVAHRDYWTWTSLAGGTPGADQPVRMVSSEDEDEIEKMFQQLRTEGRLEPRTTDSSKASHED